MNAAATKTKALLEKHGVEVITVDYSEVHKYGGGIRCNSIAVNPRPGAGHFLKENRESLGRSGDRCLV